ncbi:MAG: hypothetical protein ACRD9W_12455, partial [Terriglobia bacterium]
GYQNVRPASKDDLLIGDHVVFFNHLAFDGLNVRQGSPWRLENAVLTDKDEQGKDLFLGHGSGSDAGGAETEHQMLVELAKNYNAYYKAAKTITSRIDRHDAQAETERQAEYPWVIKEAGKWVIVDPGRQPERLNRRYPLDSAKADERTPETDVLMPGLLDPLNRGQLNSVDRPIESAPGKPPQP